MTEGRDLEQAKSRVTLCECVRTKVLSICVRNICISVIIKHKVLIFRFVAR